MVRGGDGSEDEYILELCIEQGDLSRLQRGGARYRVNGDLALQREFVVIREDLRQVLRSACEKRWYHEIYSSSFYLRPKMEGRGFFSYWYY